MKTNKIITELRATLKSFRAKHERIIENFKKSMEQKKSISYVLKWQGEEVLEADKVIELTHHLHDILNKESVDLSEVNARLEALKFHAERYLINGQFKPNSTCPMSNLCNIAEGLAYGKCMGLVKKMEKYLDK